MDYTNINLHYITLNMFIQFYLRNMEKLLIAAIPLIILFETNSHYVPQIDLKVAMWPRLALKL